MVQFCGVCCVYVACVYNVCISGLFMVENDICIIHTMAKYLLLRQRQGLTESANNADTEHAPLRW